MYGSDSYGNNASDNKCIDNDIISWNRRRMDLWSIFEINFKAQESYPKKGEKVYIESRFFYKKTSMDIQQKKCCNGEPERSGKSSQ